MAKPLTITDINNARNAPSPDQMIKAIEQGHGDNVLWQLDKVDAEEHLIDFMKQGWEQLEPAMPLDVTWSLEAMCDHLEAVTYGQVQKLLINVPPGFTKSMTTNVFWPAWEWGPLRRGNYRYISMSYADALSIRDNVRCRDLLKSEWYQERWGGQWEFKGDQDAKTYYENTMTGWRKAASSGSALTGFRGDRLILDDPHSVKGADSDVKREDTLQWFSETLPSRVNSKKTATVVIMQRVHEADVSGLILAKELGYTHLMLPMEFEKERRCYTVVQPSWHNHKSERVAKIPGTDMFVHGPEEVPEDHADHIPNLEYELLFCQDLREHDGDLLAPERFDREQVDDLKKSLSAWGGSYAEAGQLQQRPAPRGGGLFQRDDWGYLDVIPDGTRYICSGWDFAATDNKGSPYTARVKMGELRDGRIIILNVARIQKGPAATKAFIKAIVEADGKQIIQDMPQDPGQAGKVQKADLLQTLQNFTVWFSPESGDKTSRAMPFASQVEGNNVVLLRGPWNAAFVAEAAMFPAGKFKDQIDAASRAYSRYLTLKRQGTSGGGTGTSGMPE